MGYRKGAYAMAAIVSGAGSFIRRPPVNLEAEQALLGAILANAKAYHLVAPFLKSAHFADPLHGRIFEACEKRIISGRLADAVSLRLWATNDPDAAGIAEDELGQGYLAQLVAATVGIVQAKEYGLAIVDAWQRRQLIEVGEEIVAGAFGNDRDPSDIVTASLAMIESAFESVVERRAVSLDTAMDDAIAGAEQASREEKPLGISTGFASIDERIEGLEPGTLHVLAGRPGMGKSALGWQMAVAAARGGHGVLAVSLEMTAKELGRRALAAASGMSVREIKRGWVGHGGAELLVRARKELAGLPLTIEDGSGLTAQQIDLCVRSAKRKHGLELVLIDHLHIVRPEDRDVRQGATWAVGRISGAMKRMAKQHRCAVLLLAQLNRQVEGRDDKRPGLADLRQAGDIEQDADTVSLLYRPEYYMGNSPERRDGEGAEKFEKRLAEWHDRKARVRGKADLIVAKVRDGEPGTVPLNFHAETTSFSEGCGG